MRPISWAIVTVAIGAVGMAAAVHYGSSPSQSASSTAVPAAVPVRVARAETRVLPVFVHGIGHVVPSYQVQVKSRVDGQIDRVLYVEGQDVHEGDPLIEIDPRPYKAALAQAEGQLAQHQAQLVSAKADLERSRSLLAKGFASRQTFDQQNAAAGQLAAALAADQGAVDAARLNLSFTTLRATISGRVGKRLVDAGNIIHAGDTPPLVEIVQIHPIAALLAVPQTDLPDIQAQLRVGSLTVEAWSSDDGKLLASGTLSLIANEIDQATGTIEIKATFDNHDDALWPGEFVNGRIITRMRNDAVAIPAAAVQPGPEGKFVYVVDDRSIARVRWIRLGAPAPGEAVVEEGLKPGETVVIDNQDQLAPDMPVHVLDAADDPAAAEHRTKSPT